MPFDYPELMKELFPAPKPGEWVNAEASKPGEFEEVLFLVDDGSAEGCVYMGHRDGDVFRSFPDNSEFRVGGTGGVGFWSLVPGHADAFSGEPSVADADRKALNWAALVLENHAEERGYLRSSKYGRRLLATAKRLRQLAGQ